MAKVKLQTEYENLLANIRWYMTRYGYDETEMGAAMRRSRATFFNRLAHPEEFTLKEIVLIAKKCGTTPQQLQFGRVLLPEAV